jgi:hypothetical protein
MKIKSHSISLLIVYFLLQQLIDRLELIYLPLIPQVLFFFCGLLVIYSRFSIEGKNEYYFVYMIPFLSGLVNFVLLREFDSVYISFLAINALVFYITITYIFVMKRSKSLN